MKIKKLLKVVAGAGLAGLVAYFAKTLYKARQFKLSCDINPDSQDQFCLLSARAVDLAATQMSDFKVGAFLGVLYVNTSELTFSKRLYDISVVADKGVISLVFPPDVEIEITCPQPLSQIIDTRVSQPSNPETLISINADIHTGILIIETR